mgnify:CR=1 FL=1
MMQLCTLFLDILADSYFSSRNVPEFVCKFPKTSEISLKFHFTLLKFFEIPPSKNYTPQSTWAQVNTPLKKKTRRGKKNDNKNQKEENSSFFLKTTF